MNEQLAPTDNLATEMAVAQELLADAAHQEDAQVKLPWEKDEKVVQEDTDFGDETETPTA